MLNPLTIPLSEEQLNAYRTDGFLLIKNALPQEILDEAWRLYDPWLNGIMDEWREQGLLSGSVEGKTSGEQFLDAWKKSGKPMFRRRPFKNLINEDAYHFLRSQVFLDLATQLLGTPEISMHGVYNARSQPPNCDWATPPFHQDAHFWNAEVGIEDSDPEVHVVTMWFPLHPVNETTGCLQMISQAECGYEMFERAKVEFETTGYVGMRPEEAAKYKHHPMRMEQGDVLAFNQKTPHRASPNTADRIRYSYDLRYEATEGATPVGDKYGFIAQSLTDPGSVTPVEEWIKKRDAYLAWFDQTGGVKK